MQLKDLCGHHILQGIDTYSFNRANKNHYGRIEAVNAVRFRLDDTTYLAIEDPDDGWRSFCEELVISDEQPKYSIPDVEVVCSMKLEERFYSDDILVITDKITGGVILEVGTAAYDGYYPYYHFEYHPENLSCNQ